MAYRGIENRHSFNAALGFTNQVNEFIQFGACFEWGPNFNEKVRYNGIDLLQIMDLEPAETGNYGNFEIISANNNYWDLKMKMPDNLNLSTSIKINEHLQTVFDVDYIFWNQLLDNYKNNYDISGSIIYQNSEATKLSTGFSARRFKQKEDYINANQKLNALFLFAGVNYQYEQINLDAVLASSYFTSGDWRKQQVLSKVAIAYIF